MHNARRESQARYRLYARPIEQLEEWQIEITEALATRDREHSDRTAAPFATNQIVHKSNNRLDQDMALCVKYKVSTPRPTATVGSCCMTSLTTSSSKKAIEKGADGLVAVAAGAGEHAGIKSPFALIQEVRE